jgi:hypothetical protein
MSMFQCYFKRYTYIACLVNNKRGVQKATTRFAYLIRHLSVCRNIIQCSGKIIIMEMYLYLSEIH